MTAPVGVTALGPEHVEAIIDTLCEAFAEYPVMTFVLGDPDPDRLRTLVHLFVMARVLRKEPLLGVWQGADLAAAAIASDPSGPPSPETFRVLRDDVWLRLGPDAKARYDAFSEATRPFAIDAPHVHLNMVGVRRAYRGGGLGRALIEEVQEISRQRPESCGVTLSTEDPSNVPYYRRLGYEITGHARVAPQLETWSFFRADPAA